jgi:hypothetical protein
MTGQQFVDDAMVDAHIVAAGEGPSDEERAYGLRLLNQLLDSLSAEGLTIPQITKSSISLTGAASYTLVARPIKPKAAQITASGLIVPVKIVTAEEWSTGAGSASLVALLYDGGFPSASVALRPVTTGGTLELWCYLALSTFAALATDVTFPPGYELAIRRLLAIQLAPGFGSPMDEGMIGLATAAKGAIQGLNAATLGTPGPQPAAGAQS